MGFKSKNDTFNSSNSSDWCDMMKLKGLLVVDIYTKWAGPCDAMVPFIQKFKTQVQVLNIDWQVLFLNYNLQVNTGIDQVQYATACSDTVPQLDRLRGICKPMFLFVMDGGYIEIL